MLEAELRMRKKETFTNELKPIPYGSIPKILLVGNGLNLSYGYQSCKDVCRGDDMPFPMQIVVSSEDSVDEQMKNIAVEFQNYQVSNEQKALLNEMLETPIDAILTTNYSLEIEKSVLDKCDRCAMRRFEKRSQYGTSQQEQFRLFQTCELPTEQKQELWHIHGNANYPNSMIMGHYYYGKLLSEIIAYVPNLIRRYRGCNQHGKDYMPRSWIDYFLLGDVHIVGMGMDLAEMDLWWLICCKKRNFPDRKIYFYEPENADAPKHQLMRNYGVDVVTDIPFDGDYPKYYRTIFNQLKNGNK